MDVKTNIIPKQQQFVGVPNSFDYKAICTFVACGFFLDDDTYFNELKVLKPASSYTLNDEKSKVLSKSHYFQWHHSPVERSFDTIVDEFKTLFEDTVLSCFKGKEVILPLSGGLDSRTLVVALKRLNIPTKTYSYAFEGGHKETSYAQKIASACEFDFLALTVRSGYLWKEILNLASMNKCYSEFTNPRQMAFLNEYKTLGNVFALGHWGDVLFDDIKVNESITLNEQVDVLLKKLLKPGCLALAEQLWKTWDLDGTFLLYLKDRLFKLLEEINITESANANIRAFKSIHWAPRWTSVNLSIFESVHAIEVPYYHNRMCEFICSVPERYLANRQIQIAYVQKYMPKLAKIAWQDHRPFNLNNYKMNKAPWNLPYRISNKISRTLQSKKYIQRNWELQFLGDENLQNLNSWLIDNNDFENLVPLKIRKQIFDQFQNGNHYANAYPVSMLLTLSIFSSLNKY